MLAECAEVREQGLANVQLTEYTAALALQPRLHRLALVRLRQQRLQRCSVPASGGAVKAGPEECHCEQQG